MGECMSRHHIKRKDRELTPYQQKLLDPRWQKKRLEILQRDDWACQECYGMDSTLHVHHKYYEQGKDPWDYQDDAFITLCASCHETETEARPEMEALLLKTLRKAGLYFDDIRELALGFAHWNDYADPRVTVHMLSWLASHKNRTEELEREYMEWLVEHGQRGTFGYLMGRKIHRKILTQE